MANNERGDVDAASDTGGIVAERNALIGRVAAGLAHDLNGPIGIVLGFADLARQRIASAQGGEPLDMEATIKLGEYLQLIESAGHRARRMAREMWNFANARPGTLSDVKVEHMLHDAAELAAPALRNAGVELPSRPEAADAGATSSESEGHAIRADASVYAHALVALFLEAESALPAGGEVSWTVSADEGSVRVELRAEGWRGEAAARWPVPESARRAFASQGATVETCGSPAAPVLSLPLEPDTTADAPAAAGT